MNQSAKFTSLVKRKKKRKTEKTNICFRLIGERERERERERKEKNLSVFQNL